MEVKSSLELLECGARGHGVVCVYVWEGGCGGIRGVVEGSTEVQGWGEYLCTPLLPTGKNAAATGHLIASGERVRSSIGLGGAVRSVTLVEGMGAVRNVTKYGEGPKGRKKRWNSIKGNRNHR